MIVKVITLRYEEDISSEISSLPQHKKGDVKCYKHGNIEFCCDEMSEAWDDKIIFFGEYDTFASINMDKNVNISKCYAYPEGTFWDEFAIKFCPFCGGAIVCED